MMIEQPLDYDDVRDHARLQEQLRTPVCLDESIHTARIAEEAIAMGACRVINIKPGRLGGHRESIRVHDLAERHAVPCGTAACWRAGSDARTTYSSRQSGTSPCPATWPRAAVTSRPI